MPAPTKNLRPVVVYVPPDVYLWLERLASKTDRSISGIARQVLQHWANSQNK